MKKFSSEAVAREFFKVASPEAILIYLDELASISLKETNGPWGPKYELPESSSQILIKRNDRVIDVGLIRILNSAYIDFLLERNGVIKEEKNLADFDLLTIALSGLGLYQFYDPPFWLEERLENILSFSSDEQLKALFENPLIQTSVLEKILLKTKWSEHLSNERFTDVIYHLLGSKHISKTPRDDFEYDSSQHDLIQACWNLLLITEPTRKNAVHLASRIENFQELDLPYRWRESFNIPVNEEGKDWKERGIIEIKEFLTIIFNKWNLSIEEQEEHGEIDNIYFSFIKEYTVRKIPSTYLEDLREFLLNYESPPITKGYFSALQSYQIDLSNFDSDLVKYKKDFLLGLTENISSFHIHNKKLILLVRDAVESYEEKEGVEWSDSIKKKYYGMHEYFKEKFPSIIIDDVYNLQEDE